MTKEMIVEVTKSSRGNTMLKVDNFKFFHERKGRDGLHYWRCVRSLCTAKFYTDEALNVVTHDSNSFQHNHVLSRTKLVKRLVIKEIKKVVALKGDSMPTAELKKYALNYLNQAFASTLKPAEMSSVKKGIHSYCKYYRSPRNMTTGLESPDTSQNKNSPYSTQSQNEHRRLKICKAVEQGMYYDYFADQIAVTSSSESDAESIAEEEKDQDSLKPLETLKSTNDPDLDFMGNVESKFAAAMFQTDGDRQLQNADSKIYPIATVIQPMGSQFSGGTVSTKPDFQESFYRNQGWPEILIKEELHTQDDSQTSVHLGFDPLGSAFAYQHIPQGEEMRLSPPGSAFSFVGAAGPPLLIPRLEPMVSDDQIVDLTAADLSQHRDFLARDDSLEDDEDHKFCLSLIPMFRRLSTSDKSMIKAQIHQLMNWKLKNAV